MGKYLFFDIDGTLVGRSGRITDNTKQALRKARENGHRVFLCTGRVPASIVGDAIWRVMEYFGEDMGETIGFGDSMNDYQMLKTVRTGAVYTGACGELRELARYYFDDPDRDGISSVMTELGLV